MDSIDSIVENDVKVVGINDKVIKTECVYSFDTPDTEEGLYIDMKNFRAIGQPFLPYHYDRYRHKVYLHHQRLKFKIDKPEGTVEKTPKRLAIGVEDGFNPDAPDTEYRYEDNYSIYLLPSQTAIPFTKTQESLPDFIRASAQSIIDAPSENTLPEKETNIWDGEIIKPSKYADDLPQLLPAPKISPSNWKCNKCDKKDNLWLNLTDGSILCGRKFYDGSGGNNHAAEHYAECKHPLAVKLGTITRDSADVYSYAEDDMVLDPHLAKHLAHFGIDIQNLSKTEKSMVELEIDMNQKLGEWSIIQEEGVELVPISGSGFIGLENLGNSCYMNSVLQVLFSFDGFDCYYSPPESIFYVCDGLEEFLFQMAKLCNGLTSARYTKDKKISPKSFKRYVCGQDANFSTKLQQDAHEFMLFLLDKVESNDKFRRGTESWQMPQKPPSDIMKIIIEERLECSESKKVKYTDRVEYCLSLAVDVSLATNSDELEEYERKLEQASEIDSKQLIKPKTKIPIWSCLEQFVRPEPIEDFVSPVTGTRTTAIKTSKIKRSPKILALQMKKFQIGADWIPKKLDVEFDVPEFMSLEQFQATGKQMHEDPMEDSDDETTGNAAPDASDAFVADSEAVANLLAMGIDIEQANIALKVCNNDAQRAIEYIFDSTSQNVASNNNQTAESSRRAPPSPTYDKGQQLYQLKAFISHMGTSTMNGHYVCHIRKGDLWYIFNDAKVAISQKPPKEFGYLYFYEKLDQ